MLRTEHVLMLNTVIEESLSLFDSLEIDSTDLDSVAVAIYALTLLRHTKTAKCLVSCDNYIGLPFVSRPMIECYSDLVNLCYIDGYRTRLMEIAYRDKLKSYKNIINRSSLFDNYIIKEIKRYKKIVEGIIRRRYKMHRKKKDERARVQELKKIANKFSDEYLKKLYLFTYADLCSDTHNNLNAVEKRHLKIEENGERLIIFEKEIDVEEKEKLIEPVLFSSVEGLIEAFDFLGVTDEELDKLRKICAKKHV